MYFKVDDGTAVFPTHLVRLSIPVEYDAPFHEGIARKFQLEKEGFIAYSESEVQEIVASLRKYGINDVTVEPITIPKNYTAKVTDVKYASRSEALAHLLEDREPDSMIIPNLKRSLQKKEAKIALLTDELNIVRQNFNSLEKRLKSVEAKSLAEPVQ